MKRLFLVCLLLVLAVPAQAKTILLIRGIFGEVVAPMTDIAAALRAKGHNIILASHYAVPNVPADIAIGHSAGADAALRTKAKVVLTIDPTFLNGGCPAGKTCINRYAPIDALPFLICCGGYAVSNAHNIVVPGTPSFFIFAPGHISMPTRVLPDIVTDVTNSGVKNARLFTRPAASRCGRRACQSR